MKNKSLIDEANDIVRAVELVRLGARMQMLEAETKLSRERLLKIYKEVRGMSPPKGMLPFSTDWFITWQPNVHASLFMSYYSFFEIHTELTTLDAIIKSYHLYLDRIEADSIEPVLSLTRAWTLIRFFDADLLHLAACTECGGQFIVHAYDPMQQFVCGLCHMPSRAGKTSKPRKKVAKMRTSVRQSALV